jgi:hypothetical protein
MKNSTSTISGAQNSVNNMKSMIAWSIFFVLGISFASCASEPLTTVGLFNRTGSACPNVKIELNGKSEELKGNVPNGNSDFTSEEWPYPMPTNITLQWVTENHSNYTATLSLPKPSVRHAEFLDYHFVILPNGHANVIVIAWSGEPTQTKVEHDIVLENKLCCDGSPNYRAAAKNSTGGTIDNLDIRFGSYMVNAGTHIDGTGQNYSIATGLPYPITKSASLHWTTSDGHSWNKIVDLTNVLPSSLDDKCFWFILKEQGNAEVKIVDWNDLRAGKYPDLCHGF